MSSDGSQIYIAVLDQGAIRPELANRKMIDLIEVLGLLSHG